MGKMLITVEMRDEYQRFVFLYICLKMSVIEGQKSFFKKKLCRPWLVWLSELSANLWIKGHWLDSQSRAHAWVEGQVPSRGRVR